MTKEEVLEVSKVWGKEVILVNSYLLSPFARPKTVEPGQRHSFCGISQATILEISTHDDPEDVERFTQSQPGEAE